MDFSSSEARRPELKSWKHNAICTLPENVAGKRSNNKLKSWPNIRCRVRAEVWNDYEKKTARGKNEEGGGEGGGEEEREIMHSTSQWAFENPRSARKCLLSYGIALKWYIPEGKESHFVCITLKRSRGEQTGMRELENHQEAGGLRRRSGRARLFRCPDILLTP